MHQHPHRRTPGSAAVAAVSVVRDAALHLLRVVFLSDFYLFGPVLVRYVVRRSAERVSHAHVAACVRDEQATTALEARDVRPLKLTMSGER